MKMRAALGLSFVFALTVRAAQPEDPQSSSNAPPATQQAIRLTNYLDGETIRFPVPIIRGELADETVTSVSLVNTSSQRDTREMSGLAHKGHFSVLTELVPGINTLVLRAGDKDIPFELTYQPQTNPYFVRCVYLTDRSGATQYQSPLENDPQDYAAKLDTAMKIMQAFTAERNHDLGFGRRTFNLELDKQGKVKVHHFKQPWPAEHYYGIDDGEWWGEVVEELGRAFPMQYAKNVAIAAYTRFDPATQTTRGHTALGGGELALFGSGNLFTWPSRLQDVQPAFMDTRPLDPEKIFSDSVGRDTFWGAASTTMGATLHELCHTFGLPHTREPMDIMTRGFDQFNRAFTFVDPPNAANPQAIEFREDQIACFPAISAAALVPCRWFAMTDRTYPDDGKISARIDDAYENIIVRSDAAVAYIGWSEEGDAVYHTVPARDSRRVVLPLHQVRKHVKSDDFNLRVIDEHGQIATFDGLMKGPFVMTWQFASLTQPWQEPSSFVAVDGQKLHEIDASAAAAQPTSFEDPFIDFGQVLSGTRPENVAGYVRRTIQCDRDRRVRICTGSDDALRVWVNGQLVTQVLAMRPASIDAESNVAELHAGENTLIAEVSQGNGGWGLYLRIEDDNGGKLQLKSDGELVPARPKQSHMGLDHKPNSGRKECVKRS
ncbi:MAG: hypothetical protein ACYC6N_17145 [Pirellulaceae bacterium]